MPGDARITTATAGAQKRSKNQPPTNRPDRADRPIKEVSWMMRAPLKPAVFRMFSILGIGPARAKDMGTRIAAISQNRHCLIVCPNVRPSTGRVAAAAPGSGRFSKNRNSPTGKAIRSGSRPIPI